ncbi:MAG TPA: TonB-dependent receptor plug domain-containing protein [Paludibacter sp.]
MKLLTFFVFVSMVTASASSYSQQTKFNLKLSGVTVRQVFKEIEANSEFILLYNEKQLDANRKVDVKADNETVETILNQVFESTKNTYKIYDRQIVILAAETKISPSVIISTTSAEQKKEISGIVKDNRGLSLPGVSVVVKGTTTGIVTDTDGKFTLSVPADAKILVFSFVGMKAQEITITAKTTINLVMDEESVGIEEVVAVGYGTQKKATLTGSVTSIKGAEVIKSPAMNVSNSLAGRLPGVTLVTQSGEPGADGALIRVRGVNTLGNNNALVVVDGVPGRSLDRIDPNSIESISVLKDAAAAIYGSEAANGVILITTKRGKTGKPLIAINVNEGYSQPTKIPKLLNASEYATAINEVDTYRSLPPMYSAAEIKKFADGSDPWSYRNTDWFAATYKVGLSKIVQILTYPEALNP